MTSTTSKSPIATKAAHEGWLNLPFNEENDPDRSNILGQLVGREIVCAVRLDVGQDMQEYHLSEKERPDFANNHNAMCVYVPLSWLMLSPNYNRWVKDPEHNVMTHSVWIKQNLWDHLENTLIEYYAVPPKYARLLSRAHRAYCSTVYSVSRIVAQLYAKKYDEDSDMLQRLQEAMNRKNLHHKHEGQEFPDIGVLDLVSEYEKPEPEDKPLESTSISGMQNEIDERVIINATPADSKFAELAARKGLSEHELRQQRQNAAALMEEMQQIEDEEAWAVEIMQDKEDRKEIGELLRDTVKKAEKGLNEIKKKPIERINAHYDKAVKLLHDAFDHYVEMRDILMNEMATRSTIDRDFKQAKYKYEHLDEGLDLLELIEQVFTDKAHAATTANADCKHALLIAAVTQLELLQSTSDTREKLEAVYQTEYENVQRIKDNLQQIGDVVDSLNNDADLLPQLLSNLGQYIKAGEQDGTVKQTRKRKAAKKKAKR